MATSNCHVCRCLSSWQHRRINWYRSTTSVRDQVDPARLTAQIRPVAQRKLSGKVPGKLAAVAATMHGSTQPAGSATYIAQTLRAGTVQEHAGTVVIFGDVKHGATVIAGGDVLVWGRLHGEVHAGGKTDRQATIAALEMSPQQLRIADVAAYGSRHMSSAGHPEVAVVDNNGLQIELLPFEGLKRGATPNVMSKSMPQRNEPASAAMFTGAYILVAGLALIVFPLLTFGLLFDPRLLPVGWIRVGGVLASLYGFYYLGTGYVDRQSHQASQGFYQATVWGRLFLFAAFSIIVWRREVERTLLIPAVINLLGALTMHLALLRQQRRTI
ncbi:TPA: hypothetical protein ACH3X2_005916 [Trebouxia sp. C0005]